MNEVAIIDSGGANIASLLCAFKRLQTKAILTTDANVIQSADRVLLPGVGAARDAMKRLTNAGLVEVIRNLTQPVLGICLGMQLLCERSEEEDVECLGIIPGTANKLPSSTSDPVPNMGWCATEVVSDHQILQDIRDRSYFTIYTVMRCQYLNTRSRQLFTQSHFQQSLARTILSRHNFIRNDHP